MCCCLLLLARQQAAAELEASRLHGRRVGTLAWPAGRGARARARPGAGALMCPLSFCWGDRHARVRAEPRVCCVTRPAPAAARASRLVPCRAAASRPRR